MELSTSPKTPKRQETLGPMTPIQEWEVERATVKTYFIMVVICTSSNNMLRL